MAPKRKKPQEKLENAIQLLLKAGYRSSNDFISAFFSSKEHAVQSLRYRKESSSGYMPAKILDAWLEFTPKESRPYLNKAITKAASTVIITESTKACRDKTLQLSSSGVSVPYLTDEFGLGQIQKQYSALLPCFTMLLFNILTARNDYEHWNNTDKIGKADLATQIIVVIISMCLFFRNRATNAFQLIIGLFLSSSGVGRRAIGIFNHMGLSVSYQTVQKSLFHLSRDAEQRARDFARSPTRLWGIVYDNINFTLRKASQRLDSATEQINATTSALFSLPIKFSREIYGAALSIAERAKRKGHRRFLTLEKLRPSKEQQVHAHKAFKHAVRMILIGNAPGPVGQSSMNHKLKKHAETLKPIIRCLEHDQTQFFPLPALNEEEASVTGTIRVVKKLFTSLLGLAQEIVDVELRLTVGDWLTIRNLRLVKEERQDEFCRFQQFSWIQEASMPFHIQLNAMYSLFRTHLGTAAQSNPSSLEHQRTLLRRSKLDPKKPEYNSAKELVYHSLTARILDCTRIIVKANSISDLKSWSPSIEEFEEVVEEIVNRFASTNAAHDALETGQGDEVLAHSIFFIRDSLFFWEFCDAIHDADVGRMWVVLDFWVYMMRGAGCHNYGNEILEMKAQFEYELSPQLRELVERTWLVNRWGKKGHSIPTDLYLEHNNGFLKV